MKACIKITTLCFCFIFFLQFKCCAQSFSFKINESLLHTLNLNYLKADSCINLIHNNNEQSYARHYLLFIKYNLGLIPYLEFNNQSSSNLENINTKEPYSIILSSEIHLQKGIVEYQNKNYLSALNHFNKGYNLWLKADEKHHNYLKLNGIFNILLSQLPHPYKNWAEWFGYNGSFDTGIEQLYSYFNLTKELSGFNTEATFIIAFCHLIFNSNPKKTSSFILQVKNNINSEFLQSILLRCCFKIRNTELLSELFTQQLNAQSFIHLYYLQGKYYTQINNPLAQERLKYFIDMSTSSTFKADAIRYISWYYLINNNFTEFSYYKKLLATFNSYNTWEDKQAIYENSLLSTLNIYLVKARLLFDNGKYSQSINLLLMHKDEIISNYVYSTEYFYRIGRSYHCKNSLQEALENYHLVMQSKNKNTRYFISYAAIFTCHIHLYNNNLKDAGETLKFLKSLDLKEEKSSVLREIKQIETNIRKLTP